MAFQLSPRVGVQGADPAQSLNTALENFRNTLTEEQKREFQESTTKPDLASVIVFVAEIDVRNSSATRTSMARRLYTFLEATQQFTDVVNTFVSSNPIIAALVWGSIKTAILTASNVVSYFDKVSSMIMRIGKTAPTYQQFGELYPDCIGLQSALCDFYAIIINLCVKIIEVSRRTGLMQTISSMINPFESEFKPFLDLLDETTQKIKLEVSLASKQADQEAKKLLEYESRENSIFRPFARGFYKSSLEQQADASKWRMKLRKREMMKLKSTIRNNLSPINHEFPLRQIRKQRFSTTAEWLQKESEFNMWENAPQTAILWCLGTIGMGKTVLMSSVVDHLQLHAVRKSNEIVCYYFCRVDNEASLSARNILGSLARQILDTQIEQSDYETLLYLEDETRDLSTIDVVQFLLLCLETSKAKKCYYIILDGLDECDSAHIQAVAQAIVELCSKYIGFKILCAGRPGLEKRFKSDTPQYRIMVNEKKVNLDMDCYITKILDKCLEEEVLILGDSAIITEIRNTLRDKADGMFLWASLCIEELCAQNCDHDILEALKHIPHSLAELYDRKLRRVREGRVAEQAMKILQYCVVVKRPLTVMEYREALSLSLEQKAFDRGKVPNDMDRIIHGCCGLTFADEEDDTIHYVHRSVKECLFITNGPHTAQFDVASVDRHFGFMCMTYLDFSNFKRQLAKVKNGSGTPIHPIQLGTSTLSISSKSVTTQIARKILSHHRQLQHFSTREVERTVQERLGDVGSPHLEGDFQFFNYARSYWLNHLTDFTPEMNNDMWGLFRRCIEGDDVPTCTPWELEPQTDSKRNDIPDSIQWLLAHEHHSLLLYYARLQPHVLSENVKDFILMRGDIHNRYRYTEVIVSLKNTSEILDNGLSYAVRDGCIRSLAVLLQAGADVGAKVNHGIALNIAAKGNHMEMVQALLAAKADVNAAPFELCGRTAIQAAAEGGHLKVVQTLLAAKAEVNVRPTYNAGRTALQAAAEGGHLEVVQTLLAAKADVNARPADKTGRTALQAAAEGGHLEVVQTLLAANADVNAPLTEVKGRTALQAAAGGGHLNIVQILLSAKADVNALSAPNNGRTAIQAAAEGGYLDVVQILLAAKADVNAPPANYDGAAALQAAAERGHLAVVQALLAAKADIDPKQTAYKAAIKGGHTEVAQTLLAAMADIDAKRASRKTAIKEERALLTQALRYSKAEAKRTA
ncbi:uncharacterized protein PGRI_084390 [Penicillium griseofulvum]|uniref:Uncharacterized protein n=1 Tax=Penicillium patulum TaxID=5078 RepID=A0A135LT72_PENPA|nr:uncharacterized protein PGRI_084390 [Penicillium griseofulvum]KXG52155.1 hypothetical protein PGRI_084390 [Penicillium griseofulvum]